MRTTKYYIYQDNELVSSTTCTLAEVVTTVAELTTMHNNKSVFSYYSLASAEAMFGINRVLSCQV